jgi:putative pyruvate formate lyase activating enzyme
MPIETPRSPAVGCTICPRKCKVDRSSGAIGFCAAGPLPTIAHYGLHFGEEPPISGIRGSGTIFFSPCNLRCVFCQNHQISHHLAGENASVERLIGMFFELEKQGAHNINLVSPTPYAVTIARAIRSAKADGLKIPFLYNTNAYENVRTVRMMDGLIDIYLPDFKYWSSDVARRLSGAPDYAAVASAAIEEMKSQVGDLKIQDGVATRGLLIRHLVLPGGLAGTKKIAEWIEEHLDTQTSISLMSQYNPVGDARHFPIINRRVRMEEYDPLIDFLAERGFENVYIQELESAEVYLPDFRKRLPFDK